MPTDAMTSSSRSAVAMTASHSLERVEMLSIALTPAARARLRIAGWSSARPW
jgi:hypothetical protein